MTVSLQQDGGLADRKIEFQADNCTGVSVVSNALDFSCEMYQEEKTLAELDSPQILPDDVIVAAADAAPAADEAIA